MEVELELLDDANHNDAGIIIQHKRLASATNNEGNHYCIGFYPLINTIRSGWINLHSVSYTLDVNVIYKFKIIGSIGFRSYYLEYKIHSMIYNNETTLTYVNGTGSSNSTNDDDGEEIFGSNTKIALIVIIIGGVSVVSAVYYNDVVLLRCGVSKFSTI